MQYGTPIQSSTVELNRMYVCGAEKFFGYSWSYLILLDLVSGVGMYI